MISLPEQLLINMAALNQNFHIRKSKLAGDFDTKLGKILQVDTGTDPENWRALDEVTGNQIPISEITGSAKKTIAEFILQYKEEKEYLEAEAQRKKEEKKEEKKEPAKKDTLDNLKAGGFEGLPENQEEELEKEQKRAEEKKASEESLEAKKKTEQEEKARKLEEDKKKLEMIERAEQEEDLKEQQKASQKPGTFKQPQEKQAIFTDRPVEYVDVPTPKKGEANLVDVLQSICKNDLMQIYGNTGTGKTTICTQLAFDAKKRGLKVRYIDTEHNRNEDQVTAIIKAGIKYDCIKRFHKLCEEVTRLVRSEDKWDFLIVDSAGAPALATYCKTNMSGQGEILKKFIAMSDDLKTYADDKKCTVVVVNQPESSMNKGEDAILEPFGEKSRYYYKEILKTNYAKKGRKTEKTTIVLSAHRSRCMGIDTPICTMEITNDGVKVIQ